MAMLSVNYSAPILRNKGVPVHLIRLNAEGEPITRTEHDDETDSDYEAPVLDLAYLRITNNTLADLEEIYGSMDEFETALDEKTTPTLRTVFGLAFDGDPKSRVAFGRIADITEAATAATTAFALASGLDPQTAVAMHRKALALAVESVERRGKTIMTAIANMEEEAAKKEAEETAEETSPEASPTSPPSSEPTSTPTPSSEPPSNSPSNNESLIEAAV